MPHAPHRPDRELTDEEGVVLAVTIKHSPCSPDDVKRHVDHEYRSLISLDIAEIETILRRLEAMGLVSASVEGE